MALTSQSHDDDAAREILESQVRECFGRVVYSHKTHEKCADLLLTRFAWLKNTQIVLSVFVSGSVITQLAGKNAAAGIFSVILSTVLLFINLYFKNYNFGQLAESHKETADRLWSIRESYLSLIADLATGVITLKDAMDRRDRLQKELGSVYSRAPRTNSSGYAKAQKALKYKEDLTFSNEEIDAFLPGPLKKEKGRATQ